MSVMLFWRFIGLPEDAIDLYMAFGQYAGTLGPMRDLHLKSGQIFDLQLAGIFHNYELFAYIEDFRAELIVDPSEAGTKTVVFLMISWFGANMARADHMPAEISRATLFARLNLQRLCPVTSRMTCPCYVNEVLLEPMESRRTAEGDFIRMVPTTFQGNQEAPLICLAIYQVGFIRCQVANGCNPTQLGCRGPGS